MNSPACYDGLGTTPALPRSEVPLIDLDVRRELTPLATCAGKDMTKLDVLRVQKRRVIECACRHRANARHGLQPEPEIRTATRAEVDLQPSARFVRCVAVAGRSETEETNVLLLKHDLGPKRRAGTALTP